MTDPTNAASAQELPPPLRFEIRKLGYSVNPWRVVEVETGRELWTHEVFDHPSLGQTVIPAPMSYPRKRDALVALTEIRIRQGEKQGERLGVKSCSVVLRELLTRAGRDEPLSADISDYSDEFCAGFLRGQENALLLALEKVEGDHV